MACSGQAASQAPQSMHSPVPTASREFIALDAQWYRDPESVRARINQLRPADTA